MMNKEDAFLYKCIEKFLEEKKNEQLMVKTTRMEKVVDVLIIGITRFIYYYVTAN